MALPSGFALLAVNPAIRENDGFLFLQTGIPGYIDLFLQSATGTPVNIMKITSGAPIASTLYVNANGDDTTAKKETIDFPFKTIGAALNSAGINDLIEVFPGSYDVSGNIYKIGVSFYFHKGATTTFKSGGMLQSTGSNTGIFNIFGHGYFVKDDAATNFFRISGGQAIIEFDSMDFGNANAQVLGTPDPTANVVFRTQGEGNSYGGQFICNHLSVVDSNVRFEGIKFETSRIATNGSGNVMYFGNCIFPAADSVFSNPFYQFSGKFFIEDSIFTASYPRFIGSKAQVKNTEFNGGIIVSGSSYFDSCIFDAANTNIYPNNSLISNLGGHSVFSNCYAKDFDQTSNAQYTFRNSGSAPGATNFNINGTFSSFVPAINGTNIQYGIFSYNLSAK